MSIPALQTGGPEEAGQQTGLVVEVSDLQPIRGIRDRVIVALLPPPAFVLHLPHSHPHPHPPHKPFSRLAHRKPRATGLGNDLSSLLNLIAHIIHSHISAWSSFQTTTTSATTDHQQAKRLVSSPSVRSLVREKGREKSACDLRTTATTL